jgi:hypothetical protein
MGRNRFRVVMLAKSKRCANGNGAVDATAPFRFS